jgi:hypothetical protein
MTEQKSFDRGMLAGMLLMLGAIALHWFITPMRHPDAGTIEYWLTGIQAVVGIGGAIWLIVRRRARPSASSVV